jgi:hypothetical protein
MKERPILFSAPMVRALLAGTKTQTRRAIKPQPTHFNPAGVPRIASSDGPSKLIACRYGESGDRLWVKETFVAFGHWETRFSQKKRRDEWHFVDLTLETAREYRFDDADTDARRLAGAAPTWHRRPSIFMPRAASRLLLSNESVRVERLQDISEADAEAEGVDFMRHIPDADETLTAIELYEILWEAINGAGSWALNPWVWGVDFKQVESST